MRIRVLVPLSVVLTAATTLLAGPASAIPPCDRPNPPPICDESGGGDGPSTPSTTPNVPHGGNHEQWTDNPYYGSRSTQFADVTGDGKADAIVVNDNGITVRRSNGSTFTADERWTTNAYYGSRSTQFADVTGDGKADAIVVNDNGITVRPSDGSTFLPDRPWLGVPFYGSINTTFTDVTGDGFADGVVVNHNGIAVRRSTF